MFAFEAVAERRILDAIARGDLERLPGRGRPLALDDDSLVPAAARMACRVSRNAGYAPPEVALRREIAALEAVAAGDDRARVLRRLAVLRTRLETARGGPAHAGRGSRVRAARAPGHRA